MNKQSALESLKYYNGFIDEINEINSNALVSIINNDVNELKSIHQKLIQLREDNDDMKNAKPEYQLAIEYFINKMSKE